ALDLVLQPPPFLDHHDAGRIAARGIGEIAGGILAVRTLEGDAGAHGVPPLEFLAGFLLHSGGIGRGRQFTSSVIASEAKQSREVAAGAAWSALSLGSSQAASPNR